jgi:hypothetical protein
MSITRFFEEVLGAKLKNLRFSWGAVDPRTSRVFLRVWEDEIQSAHEGERVLVARKVPRRKSAGYAERLRQIDMINSGAEGFGVVCTATDPATSEVRKIARFDDSNLLRFGAITIEDGDHYARITGRPPVEELIREHSVQDTLVEDLIAINEKDTDPTTKEALVNARIGQGRFRTQVRQLWGNRCSVTRSTTLDAIRASHIKPWRESTDEERLDPTNGLPLTANLDALFDKGWISFDSSGRLIASSGLNTTERQIYGLDGRSLSRIPPSKTCEYLAYHRANVFRDRSLAAADQVRLHVQ